MATLEALAEPPWWHKVKRIDLPDSPKELPWLLRGGGIPHVGPNTSFHFADLSGDSVFELPQVIAHQTAEGKPRSSVIVYTDFFGRKQWSEEYHGFYRRCRIIDVDFVDLLGGPGTEMVLSKCVAETLILEVLSFDSSCYSIDTIHVKTIIGRVPRNAPDFDLVHSACLAAADLNGDGGKELIHLVTGMPAQCVVRGISAFDLRNNKRLWFYPTADLTKKKDFHLVRDFDGSVVFAFVLYSSANNYAANGMESWHAYAVAVDGNGNELWRETIGEAGFHPHAVLCDIDGDNREEFCVSLDRNMTRSEGVLIRCYDPISGYRIADV